MLFSTLRKQRRLQYTRKRKDRL